jgi:hypothetical protein
VINFGERLPGTVFGSGFTVFNQTPYEQIIDLSFDDQNLSFSRNEMIKKYPVLVTDEDIPLPKKERLVNSEMTHECWYIENPVTKELTKRILLKIGASSEQ